jgi:type II secretory pathway component PulK
MADISELRSIPAMSYSVYAALVLGKEPLVTALPTDRFTLNVNYASVFGFMTLNNVSSAQAQQLAACRGQDEYFKTPDAFITRCATGGISLKQGQLATTNVYYLVEGDATEGAQHLHMQALLYLYTKNNAPEVRIIWQEYGSE